MLLLGGYSSYAKLLDEELGQTMPSFVRVCSRGLVSWYLPVARIGENHMEIRQFCVKDA
jgi:hypothetical protein